jgi:hypothetical protein
LKRFLEDRPVQARRSTPVQRFWRWCRRDPWLSGAGLVAVAAILILVVGATGAALVFRTQRDQVRSAETQGRERCSRRCWTGRARDGSASAWDSGSTASTPWNAPPGSAAT